LLADTELSAAHLTSDQLASFGERSVSPKEMCMRGHEWRLGVVLASLSLSVIPQYVMAALPSHPVVHTFEPTHAESVDADELPLDVFAGAAVAARNETAIVGMPGISKLAIYKRASSGWSRTASIVAPDASAGFGKAIAYRDDTIVAGSDSAAYVFKLSNGAWRYTQKLITNEFEVLAYQDSVVVTGSSLNDGPGLVHVFELNASGKLVRRTKLQPSDSTANDLFGADVAMSANTIVVGAPGSAGGAAYIFKRASSGWSQSQRLRGQGSMYEGFGAAVAINNGVIVVGAPDEDFEWSDPQEGLRAAGGAAFVFIPNATGVYAQTQRLRPASRDVRNFQAFGLDIAMSGDRIVVLAEQLVGGSAYDAPGQAFTYRLAGNRAAPVGLASMSPPFNSVALANNWLFVGQPIGGGCLFYGCAGQVTLYDVNRLQ
jgi:hypothetical protein